MIGFVNVYKPSGMTSFQVVVKLKKIYNTKRVGHLGTLDPMAEGVLPVAIGKATKFFDYFLKKDKAYSAVFKCGVKTDTLDAEGEIEEENDFVPTIEEVKIASQKFVGKIQQIPPKFSAKKINGIRAYSMARSGKDFELKPNQVEIYSILASNGSDDKLFNFEIECSSGTYIRSLGVDILGSINTLATMVKLVRTRAGLFKIEDSFSLDKIEREPQKCLMSISNALKNVENVVIDDNQFFKLKNGVSIPMQIEDGEYLVNYNEVCLGLASVQNQILKLTINCLEE